MSNEGDFDAVFEEALKGFPSRMRQVRRRTCAAGRAHPPRAAQGAPAHRWRTSVATSQRFSFFVSSTCRLWMPEAGQGTERPRRGLQRGRARLPGRAPTRDPALPPPGA